MPEPHSKRIFLWEESSDFCLEEKEYEGISISTHSKGVPHTPHGDIMNILWYLGVIISLNY